MNLQVDFRLALPNFSLEVAFETSAEFLVVYGPSGSGKSMTLRALAGLAGAAEGKISVGGESWLDTQKGLRVPTEKRNIGYVFQDYALFPHLTARENVAFGLRRGLFNSISAKDAEWVSALLGMLDLSPHGGRRVGELSGGQRQRVALGRALATRPGLLLLDEPFSALDRELRQRMREDLRRIRKDFDVPTVMVTHDIEDVQALADEMVVLENGKVKRSWSFRSICRQRKVADFVSSHGPLDRHHREAGPCAQPA